MIWYGNGRDYSRRDHDSAPQSLVILLCRASMNMRLFR